eukprot:7386820-Prymnesium_polylepis.1
MCIRDRCWTLRVCDSQVHAAYRVIKVLSELKDAQRGSPGGENEQLYAITQIRGQWCATDGAGCCLCWSKTKTTTRMLTITVLPDSTLDVQIDLQRAQLVGEWWRALQFAPQELPSPMLVTAVPTPLLSPSIVCLSSEALALLSCSHVPHDVTAEQLAGNELPVLARPSAHCYCGHQFGFFAATLGDGAALTLDSGSLPGVNHR